MGQGLFFVLLNAHSNPVKQGLLPFTDEETEAPESYVFKVTQLDTDRTRRKMMM